MPLLLDMTDNPYQIASPAQLRHALRTPLNHIIGYSEMIAEEIRDSVVPGNSEWALPSLDAILFNARELVRFVQNALPAAKAELSSKDVADLQMWLRPHLLDLMGDIGALRDIDPEHVHDTERIERAGQRLLSFSNGSPEALTEAVPAPEETNRPAHDASIARLLVVDDSAQNRDILRRSLERNGYAVELAENGAAALDRIRAASFDLVLLDVVMPVMDGYALLSAMKSADQFRDVPVIMISALDEGSAVVRCMQLGAEDYIMKPFDPVLVRTRVGAALDRWRARRQLNRIRTEIDTILAVPEPPSPQDILARLQALLNDS